MFRLGDDADFVAVCRRMIGALIRSPGVAHGRCRVYDGMIWCETLVPVALGDIVGVCLLGPGFVRRVTARPLLSPSPRNGDGLRVCRLLLDCGAVASGPMMVTLFGESGVAWRHLTGSPRRLPALSELIGQQPAWLRGARRDVIQALATLSAGDPRARSLVREIAALTSSPATPINQALRPLAAAAEQLLAVDGRLLAAGWIVDRFGLVDAIQLSSATGRRGTVPLEAMSWATPVKVPPAADHQSSFLFVTDQQVLADDVGDRCWLSLELRSGGAIEFAEGPDLVEPGAALARLTATLASGRYRTDQVLRHIEPLATGLRRHSFQRRPDLEIIEMGISPRRPTASLIIDAGEDQGRLSAVLSLLAIDPQIDATELLIVVTDAMWRTKVSELMASYRLPGRLLVVSDAATRSAALNCAAAASTAPLLVFLEGNAVPETPGWFGALATLLDARPERGLVAALPVHSDQSIAGVGIDFVDDFDGTWRPRSRLGGFPRDYREAKTASVAATIAGCCRVWRSLFERIDGFTVHSRRQIHRFLLASPRNGRGGLAERRGERHALRLGRVGGHRWADRRHPKRPGRSIARTALAGAPGRLPVTGATVGSPRENISRVAAASQS